MAPDRGVIAGLVNSAQRATLTRAFWEELGGLLASLPRHGTDVVIDAGRVGMQSGPTPLLQRANLIAVLSRTRLDHIVSVTANAVDLRGEADVATDRVGVITVGEGQPYSSKDVARATGLPVWASLAWDPVAADRLSTGKEISRARLDKSSLLRSARTVVGELTRVAQRREQVLDVPGGRS